VIQPMVEHLVAHPAEAAAAFLDPVKVGKTEVRGQRLEVGGLVERYV
jgi:hypothetical protein